MGARLVAVLILTFAGVAIADEPKGTADLIGKERDGVLLNYQLSEDANAQRAILVARLHLLSGSKCKKVCFYQAGKLRYTAAVDLRTGKADVLYDIKTDKDIPLWPTRATTRTSTSFTDFEEELVKKFVEHATGKSESIHAYDAKIGDLVFLSESKNRVLRVVDKHSLIVMFNRNFDWRNYRVTLVEQGDAVEDEPISVKGKLFHVKKHTGTFGTLKHFVEYTQTGKVKDAVDKALANAKAKKIAEEVTRQKNAAALRMENKKRQAALAKAQFEKDFNTARTARAKEEIIAAAKLSGFDDLVSVLEKKLKEMGAERTREWTISGKKVTAQFLSLAGDRVTLVEKNGRKHRVRLDALSLSDRSFIDALKRKR